MSFFKAYDMRGTYGIDFDLDTVFRVGNALPGVIEKANGSAGRRFLVGRDCRETSESIRDALVKGLVAAGAEVTDLGLCTTPMVYFFTAEDGYDGSVMITASHNPPTDNGLKVSRRGALPVGYADGLDEVERLVGVMGEDARLKTPGAETRAVRRETNALARYIAWMSVRQTSNVKRQTPSLSYALDCSNGMASLLAHELFPGALIINDTLDGRFPNHSPNPLKAEAREQVAALVREKGLDCGVIFDGDADRCMFVDERGEFVQPDYLIPVVARATLNARREASDAGLASGVSRPKVIHDVRTSRGAIDELKRMGCEPVMVPVGHAFAKPVLRKTGGVCGGELAGHYYFSEFHCCDSGALAALRILGEIAAAKTEGKPFSEMMKPISGVYENSGEINFKVEDKDAAIVRALAAAKAQLPPEVSRSDMDGIRVEYADGWINIRKSNTEPYLRLVAERRGDVSAWVSILSSAISNP